MEIPSLSTPPAGSLRFNTDSKKLEIYNGEAWWEIDSTSPDAQTSELVDFLLEVVLLILQEVLILQQLIILVYLQQVMQQILVICKQHILLLVHVQVELVD